jgi:hypothetical protein
MKLPSRRWLLALAPALAGSLPWQVMANDRDLRATTVPAASCEVDGTAALWRNNREFGVWGRQSEEQEVPDFHHRCPLPLNPDYSPALAVQRAMAVGVTAGEPAPRLSSRSLMNNPG